MMLWFTLLAIGAITYAIRLSCITFFSRVDIPSTVLSILRFVPVVVLTAIIVPQLFLVNNVVTLSPENPRWIAGIIATIVAWRTHNVLLTIAVGMVALWILQIVLRYL